MKELYSIKFNKAVTDKDIFFSTYTLGTTFTGRGLNWGKIPVKIEFIKEETKILITFEGTPKTYHEIWHEPGVELFWKEIDETKTKAK